VFVFRLRIADADKHGQGRIMSILSANRIIRHPSFEAFRCNLHRAPGVIAAAAVAITFAASVPAQAQTTGDRMLGYAQPQDLFAPNDRLPDVITDSRESVDAMPDRLKRTVVSFNTREAPGTIIIDTANTQLYYVLGDHRAIRYGVGVGREGFTWSGVKSVARKAEWPDWHPPAAMIKRQPYLPRFMAGGPGNPLGAAAMYLGSSDYRIHGTNDPSTIGKFVSSGCIRLTNDNIRDLYSRVHVGAKVIVLPKNGSSQLVANAIQSPRKLALTTSAQLAPRQARTSGLY
jgi:lipoprotein-anchoring transpeptidase ErfK/SrfK